MDARIADLGLATLTENEETAKQTHAGGTRGYQAPEITTKKFSNKADIYSLAVMFFVMAVGKLPDITSSTFAPLEAKDDPGTLELLQFMLKLNPKERPTAAECAARVEPVALRARRDSAASLSTAS